MRDLIPKTIVFCLFLILVSVERVVGWPFFSLFYIIMQTHGFAGNLKLVPVLFFSFVLSIVYALPFWMGLGIVTVLVGVFEQSHEHQFLKKHTELLFGMVVAFALCIGLIDHTQFGVQNVVWYIADAVAFFAVMRYVLHHQQPRQVLSLSSKFRARLRNVKV
jgi:hypothetical protein